MLTRSPADRHTADRHVSLGHLNFLSSHMLECRKSRPLSYCRRFDQRLAGYLPSCTGGSALAETGRKAGAVTQWLRATLQNNARDRSRSTEPFCTMEKHTGSHRHDQHIKHIPKNEEGRWGLQRGIQEQLFTGAPSEALRVRPLVGLAPLLFSCILLFWMSVCSATKATLVSIT